MKMIWIFERFSYHKTHISNDKTTFSGTFYPTKKTHTKFTVCVNCNAVHLNTVIKCVFLFDLQSEILTNIFHSFSFHHFTSFRLFLIKITRKKVKEKIHFFFSFGSDFLQKYADFVFFEQKKKGRLNTSIYESVCYWILRSERL